jgi:hypothetical protein
LNQPETSPIVSQPIADALKELEGIVTRNFDHRMWLIVKACCSVVATLMLKDSFNPVGLILVDNPSTGKTTALSMFYDLPMVYRSDNFTPSSFVSHASNVKKEKLEKIDLLPRIRHNCLVVPELAPIFGQKQEDLLKSISILTRVFDGEGYWSDSGVHGGRGYKGDYYFTMLGATPPMPKAVWKVLGQFGSRLLFYTLNTRTTAEERMAKTYLNVFDSGSQSFGRRLLECRGAVTVFFRLLKEHSGQESFARSVAWPPDRDSQELKWQISQLAEFTSRARSKVSVWDSNNRNSEEKTDFSQPLLEGSERLTSILYSLACGHALIHGRSQLAEEDMLLIVETAFSSMPDDRRQVIRLMLEEPSDLKEEVKGVVSSTDIRRALSISTPTALKLIDELALLGIGEKFQGDNHSTSKLKLRSCYSWFLTQQFADYRRSSNLLI